LVCPDDVHPATKSLRTWSDSPLVVLDLLEPPPQPASTATAAIAAAVVAAFIWMSPPVVPMVVMPYPGGHDFTDGGRLRAGSGTKGLRKTKRPAVADLSEA
jgi:hypothetical protein